MKETAPKPEPSLRRLMTPGRIFFGLSLVYLLAEAYFNAALLNIAGTVRSTPAEIDHIQHFGRAVSAGGCTLLVLGLVIGKKRTSQQFWRMVSLVAALCALPFLAILLHFIPSPQAGEAMIAFLPLVLAGLCWIFRKQRPVILLALGIMVWSAVYVGQKILIEEVVVSKTTAEDRLNARYALLLRAGFEDCTITLDDLRLCDDARQEQQIVKSARVILAALWMLYPDGIRHDMTLHRNEILISAARRGTWISPQKAYAEYITQVKQKRQDIEDEITKKLYTPYAEASETYAKALKPETLAPQIDATTKRIETSIDSGWVRYQSAIRDYKNEVSFRVFDAMRQARSLSAQAEDIVGDVCRKTGRCSNLVERAQNKAQEMAGAASSRARRKFSQATGGYDPDIETRAGFSYHPVTQAIIRKQLEAEIKQRPGLKTFILPLNWRYDPVALQDLMMRLARVEADAVWQKNVRADVPPGLPRNVFLETIGIEPVPAIDKILLPPDQFFDKILIPKHKEMAVQMFDKMTAEMPDYADGKPLAEQGRSYVRAAYIPSISLVISLLVVMLTLARGIFFAAKKWVPAPKQIRVAAGLCVVILLLLLPYAKPNAYVANLAYVRYFKGAEAGHPVVARVLDWTLHTQPLVYSVGMRLR